MIKRPFRTELTEEFLFSRRIISDKGCWIWQGSIQSDGYGTLSYKSKNLKVHRVSYEMFVGSIPDGLVVRHNCDNPPCFNPSHLDIGTQADNIKDMDNRGRRITPTSMTSHRRKLDWDKVREARKRFSEGNITVAEMARQYNVDWTAMKLLLTNQTWKEK